MDTTSPTKSAFCDEDGTVSSVFQEIWLKIALNHYLCDTLSRERQSIQ
jgi:hypothetical protein